MIPSELPRYIGSERQNQSRRVFDRSIALLERALKGGKQ
jgi:hypothetical protein